MKLPLMQLLFSFRKQNNRCDLSDGEHEEKDTHRVPAGSR